MKQTATEFVCYEIWDGFDATRFSPFRVDANELAHLIRWETFSTIRQNAHDIWGAVVVAALRYVEAADWDAVAAYILRNTDAEDWPEPEPFDDSEGDWQPDSRRPEYSQPYMSRW